MRITPVQNENYNNKTFTSKKINVNPEILKSLLDKSLSNKEIAATLNCSTPSVSRLIKEYNLTPVYKNEQERAVQEINKYIQEGLSVAEIEKLTGYGRTKIYSLQEKSGGKFPSKLKKEQMTDKVMKEHNKGLSTKEIAEKLNISESSVHKYYKNAGYTKPHEIQKLATKEDLEVLINQGKSGREIAKILGTSSSWVSSLTKTYGLESVAKKNRTKMEALIKPYVDAGYKLEEIAQKLGKKVSTIYHYVRKCSEKTTLEIRQEKIQKMFEQNLSNQEIADILGISRMSVKDMRYRYSKKKLK